MAYHVSELQAKYREKRITADEAAAKVRDGDRVHYGMCCGAVKDLDDALAKRINELHDVEILSLLAIRDRPFSTYTSSKSNETVRFLSSHWNGFDRKMAREGRCDYMPILFREMPWYWYEPGVKKIDVCMLQVGPMNEWGEFNLGPQIGDMWGVIDNSKMLIVEVNEAMPFAHGMRTSLNLSQVDFVVEGSNAPLTELAGPGASEIDKGIARHIVEKIPNGATLQLGIGSLPTCIGAMLCESDVKDLSGHSEMLCDPYYDLYMAGKLTNTKKVNEGRMLYTFAGGRKTLYDFIDNNPALWCAPTDYVNDIYVISQMEKFVSINSCLQVDIMGQVCSEAIGPQHISGTGGQMDFVLGAYKSKGGQSFICTPSTKTLKDGSRESCILPMLPLGSVVTTTRSATHWVVTEYGAVDLKGRSLRQRAELLISIAHPDFREELIRGAQQIGLWSNTAKRSY